MDPSPQAVALIRARVTDWTADVPAIVAALNAPDPAFPNPVPRGTVPVPFTPNDLAGACSATNRGALAPMLAGSAAALVLAQAAGPIAAGLDALETIGQLAAADVAAMKAVMARTQPDPAWQSQTSWAAATIGRPVDPLDVAAAREGV